MGRQIVAVRMSGGEEHKHIAAVAYLNTASRPVAALTAKLADIVKMIDDGADFFTRDYRGDVAIVVVVKNSDGDRYIRTEKDGTRLDNLLFLPRYEFD